MTRTIMLSSLSILLLLNVLVPSPAQAENDADEPWPVEQRCIPDPVLPPDDWSYPGTILMSGYAGIHGIRADWETPHILAFFRKDANGDYPLRGGQLSPDAHWYAAPIGETWAEISFNNYWDVRGVRLYSMSGDGEEIIFDLADYRDLYQYFSTAWSYLPIEWRGTASFVIGGILIHPFDNEVESAAYDTVGTVYDDRYFSPDLTRMDGRVILDAFGEVVTYQSLTTFDYSVVTGLARLDDPKAGVIGLGKVDGLSWRRDSAGLIAQVENATESGDQLILYDRDGVLTSVIFDLGRGRVDFRRGTSGRNDLRWSPDNKQFAFTYSPPYPERGRLHIVNLDEELVIDTCLNPISQPVWSPDGKMLAYLAVARENLKIIVVDVEAWKAYDIGRHSGRRSLAGSPEMVGWRD